MRARLEAPLDPPVLLARPEVRRDRQDRLGSPDRRGQRAARAALLARLARLAPPVRLDLKERRDLLVPPERVAPRVRHQLPVLRLARPVQQAAPREAKGRLVRPD